MLVHRVVTNPAPGLSALAELVEHPEDFEELIALRNLTDDQARMAVQAISVVPDADFYRGVHRSVVMAPFVWFAESRFSPGTFGVLYTALDQETAIRESAYHALDQLIASSAPAGRIPRVGLTMELEDVRHADCRRSTPGTDPRIYDATDYSAAQALGASMRQRGHEGIRYDSVRNKGGECFATFRPASVQSVSDDAVEIVLIWNGSTIEEFEIVSTHQLPDLAT